jgi:hypothetical protein
MPRLTDWHGHLIGLSALTHRESRAPPRTYELRHGPAVPQRGDQSGHEVRDGPSSGVAGLAKGEEPGPPVLGGQNDTAEMPHRLLLGGIDVVVVRQASDCVRPFFGGEPRRGSWEVGEDEDGDEREADGHHAFD